MKITDLKVKRLRTVHEKDSNGNRIRRQVEYMAKRPVKVVDGGKRFAHFFIDLIVIQVLLYCLEFILSLISTPDQVGSVVVSIGFFSIGLTGMLSYPLYYVITEHLWQKSPGKFITKSIVVDSEGQKPDLQTNILRNIIRLVPFEIFSCLSYRGWHDRWSETYVISEEEYSKIQELLDEQKKEK